MQRPVPLRHSRAEQAALPRSGLFYYARTMLIFLAIWQLGAGQVGNRLLLPSPMAVGQALWGLAGSGDLLRHALTSLTRLLVSLGLAVLIGLPLGLLIGMSRIWNELFEVLIEILRPISGIAWIPLALFLFGIGNRLPVFIMVYAALFPLLIGTAAGVRQVDRNLLAAAETMGLPRRQIVLRVVLPAALPSITVALRLAVASAWTAVVAAELVGAPSGLGYAIDYYRSMLATDHVIAFILVIALLGYVTDRLLRQAQRIIAPWQAEAAA